MISGSPLSLRPLEAFAGTTGFAVTGAGIAKGLRGATVQAPSGFVPLAEMEASAVRISAPPSGLSSRVAVQNGNLFNRVRSTAYQYSELYIDHPAGGRFRVDAYNPGTEIVSRKFTQLAGISEKSAISYIREAATKYAPGSRIANVTSSGPVAGQTLQGQLYLEVPIQSAPVPQSVLNAAQRYGVSIRDINGKVH